MHIFSRYIKEILLISFILNITSRFAMWIYCTQTYVWNLSYNLLFNHRNYNLGSIQQHEEALELLDHPVSFSALNISAIIIQTPKFLHLEPLLLLILRDYAQSGLRYNVSVWLFLTILNAFQWFLKLCLNFFLVSILCFWITERLESKKWTFFQLTKFFMGHLDCYS